MDPTADTLEPVHVIVSAEPLLVDRAVAALRDRVVPAALRAFNLDVVDGRGAAAARVLAAARTVPMMAERRMVLIREITAMTAAEMAGLIEYLDDPCPSTVLVATASKIDRRLKFFAAVGKRGWLQELAAPRDARDLAAWVTREARERRVEIRPDAVKRLVDAVGGELSRLVVTLDQLALYVGGRAIAVDDVDDLVADTRERSVFELTDAIGAADRSRALGVVASLVDQRQSPIGVVSMLARHMRQLSLYRAGREGGMGKPELARLLAVPPFVVDKLGRQADRFPDAALDRAIAALSLTDRSLKGEREAAKTLGRGLTDRLLLEDVVQRLVDLGGGRR